MRSISKLKQKRVVGLSNKSGHAHVVIFFTYSFNLEKWNALKFELYRELRDVEAIFALGTWDLSLSSSFSSIKVKAFVKNTKEGINALPIFTYAFFVKLLICLSYSLLLFLNQSNCMRLSLMPQWHQSFLAVKCCSLIFLFFSTLGIFNF